MATIRPVDRKPRVQRAALLAALLLLGLALIYGPRLLDIVTQRLQTTEPNTRSLLSYRLDGERWTTFDVDPPDGQVRLRSSALLPAAAIEAEPGTLDLRYALEYEILDALGRVLAGQPAYFEASLPLQQGAGGQPEARLRVPGAEPRVAASSQALVLDLRPWPQADQIRLRLREAAAPLSGVVVGVYVHERIGPRAALREWLRRSFGQREQLADPLVYPPGLLDREDRVRLVANDWRAVGPLGVEGRDYAVERILYDRDAVAWQPPILPAGLFLDATRAAVLPVGPGPQRRQLHLVAADGATGGEATLFFSWRGAQPWQQDTETLRVALPAILERELRPGWFLARADRPLTLRSYDLNGLEITPEKRYSRLYRLGPGQALDYPLRHHAGDPAPLRIDLRRSLAERAAGIDVKLDVRYELYDEAERLLDAGTLPGRAPPIDPYDYPNDNPIGHYVSMPAQHYLLADPRVRRLRLLADGERLAGVFTRPAGLRHRTRVPQDYQPWLDPSDEGGQNIWFGLSPEHPADLRRAPGVSKLLRVQAAPPERDPLLAEGSYQWASIEPAGDWSGRWLFEPRDPAQPTRPRARASVFSPLAVGTPLRPQLVSPVAGGLVRAQVYAEASQAGLLQIQLNGQSLPPRPLAAGAQLHPLPPLPPGPQALTLQAPPGRYWLNQWQDAPGSLLRRLVARLPADTGGAAGLRYLLPRPQEAQTLSGRLYRRPNSPPVRLSVRVEPATRPRNQPLPSWTVADREFHFPSPPADRVHVPGHNPAEMAAGEAFFIPLGPDLETDMLAIEIRLHGAPEALLGLSRLEAGLAEELRTRRDRPDDAPR